MPRQRETQADQRKQQILCVARERFIEDGYAGTSVASIVRTAGIAQGTFYLYFKSKQDVLVELRREALARYEAAIRDASRTEGPADLKLAIIIARIVSVVQDLMPVERVFRAAENAENTQRAALNGRARLARIAATLIAQGIDAGDFRPCTPLMTAQFIVTLFDSVLYDALAHQQPGPIEDVAEEGMRFSMRALGVHDARINEICSMISLQQEGT